MSELKPCPFCGSNDIDPNGCASQLSEFGPLVTRPACDNCGATTDASWNTRAVPKVKALKWYEYTKSLHGSGILGEHYTIYIIFEGFALWRDRDDQAREHMGVYDTPELAKAAAQSHYEKLVLEALE